MTRPAVSSLMIAAVLSCTAGSAIAADERAVLVLEVPRSPMPVQGANPACGDALDLTKILADPSLYKALLGAAPDAKRELDSTDAILRQLEKYGHTAKRLVAHRDGNAYARCQSGCAVLPRGAHVREIVVSDRHAGGSATIVPVRRSPDAPEDSELPASGTPTDMINMGDYGYEGLRITRGERAVCVTAKNWSTTESNTQIVKVFFDR